MPSIRLSPWLLGLALTCSQALADTPEQLFQKFAQCDDGFFRALPAEASALASNLTLAVHDGVASPNVGDRLLEGGRYQAFATPLEVQGVRLVGYYDEASSVNGMGDFLFWGFVAEGSVDEVQERLRPLIVDAGRLTKRGESWARVEMRKIGDPMLKWRTEGLAGAGVPTPFGQVERVLLVEPGKEPPFNGRVKVMCSLQGTVTPPLLQVYRPDLNAHLLD
jgi:hypothetical protein